MRKLKYPYTIEMMGIDIKINENVYPTSSVSEIVINTLDMLEKEGLSGKKVLDYGTGAGFLAIKSAQKGADVTAIDINPYAIECAILNAKNNNVNINFKQSDALSEIKNETFDIVLAGMPWDNDIADDYMEMALFDTNGKMKKTLFKNANKILKNDGYILMTYSDFMLENQPIEDFITDDIKWEIVYKQMIHDSEHYIIKLQIK